MRRPLLPLAALTSHTLAQTFYNDPTRTPSDCIAWHDVSNATSESCESVLRFWSMDPARFHAWNPSVGLDCTPWYDERSYCVLTNTTVWDSVNASTSTTTLNGNELYTLTIPSFTTDTAGWTIPVTRSDVPPRTTSSRPAVPTPASWTDKGCFIDLLDDTSPLPPSQWPWVLDFRFVPPAADETLEKCKHKCWAMSWPVAGVTAGTQCFCGDRVNGTAAGDQAECNVPCAGDAGVMCGGVQRMSVWQADEYVRSAGGAGSGAGSGVSRTGTGMATATTTTTTTTTATASSGARRNAGMFWRM